MKYKVILCDPPWTYRNKKTGESMSSGAASKYQTMDIAYIKSLPISSIADKNSVLFLSETTPLLPEAFTVLSAWGFKYKQQFTGVRDVSGMGYWFRGQVEVCLLGVRGNVKAFRIEKATSYSPKHCNIQVNLLRCDNSLSQLGWHLGLSYLRRRK